MSSRIVIAALYRFVRLDNFVELRAPLLQLMQTRQLRGTLLLAAEGINGTVAGSAADVTALLEYLCQDERLRDLDCKLSYDTEQPFNRCRVKLKREIVTMGVVGLDPANAGSYVVAADWDRLISDPTVTVIDTRNRYESSIGSFNNAIHTNTGSFRDFPDFVRQNLEPQQHPKVAMFCTGGIRCEKASAYLRERGFGEIYQLRGGILKYFEQVSASNSLWHGECFVFDNRVSVNHALEKGEYDQCHACRLPITNADKTSDKYQPGVSCPACYADKSDLQRSRFREREKQVKLAQIRGERHLGVDACVSARKRKRSKLELKQRQRDLAG